MILLKHHCAGCDIHQQGRWVCSTCDLELVRCASSAVKPAEHGWMQCTACGGMLLVCPLAEVDERLDDVLVEAGVLVPALSG